MRILFKNCTIVEGSNKPSYKGYVLVKDDEIEEIRSGNIKSFENGEVIDCQNKYVSPGFIDCHSHNDWFVPCDKPQRFFEPFVRQGITTFIGGNCGYGVAGFPKNLDYRKELQNGLFKWNGELLWHSCDDYFEYVKDKLCMNMALLVGHGTLRAALCGASTVNPTEEKIDSMIALMEKGMEEGAVGVSLGLQYQPSLFAGQKEIEKIARCVAKHNKILTTHARAYSLVSTNYPIIPFGRPHNIIAIDELLKISRSVDAKLQLSHQILVGRNTFKTLDKVISKIEKTYKEGVDVRFDLFSTECGVTNITAPLPEWYMKLSKSQRLQSKVLKKLRLEMAISTSLVGFGYQDIMLAWSDYPGLEEYIGLNVVQIAEKLGLSPFKAYVEILKRSEFSARVQLNQYSNNHIISKLSKHPLSLFMTDAWVEDYGIQNPAITDGILGFISKSVKGDGPSMEETIHKMTLATAERFGLKKRGLLAKGYAADVTVFDINNIADKNSSQIISHVLINGKWAMKNHKVNEMQGLGKVIRG